MKRLILLGVLVLALSIGAALFFMESSSGSGKQVVPTSEPQLSPFFQQAAERLGLQGEGLRFFRQYNPKCSESTTGEASTTVQIVVNSKYCQSLDRDSVRTIAHEYLHTIWRNLNSDKREELQGYVQQNYTANYGYYSQYLAPLRKGYAGVVSEPIWFPDEMHSIMGSEQRPDTLPPQLREWYKQWIPNHENLEYYYPSS